MNSPAVIAWILPEHAGLVADACGLAGFSIAAVGTPARGETQALADRLGAEPLPDLRAALNSVEARIALLIAGTNGTPDARTVQTAESRGLLIASAGPIAGGVIDAAERGLLKEHAGARLIDSIRLVPRARLHPVFRAATEVIEAFGEIELISIESHAPASCGGLPAALLTAFDLVHSLVGTPELIDAAAPNVPKHLGDLSGHAAALLRFPDGRSGQISASDRAAWGWRATLTGPGGRLTLRPSGFDWFGSDGERQDEHRAEARWREPTHVLAASLGMLIDAGAPQAPAAAWAELLASGETMLLSMRTGQAESPGTLLRAAHSSE